MSGGFWNEIESNSPIYSLSAEDYLRDELRNLQKKHDKIFSELEQLKAYLPNVRANAIREAKKALIKNRQDRHNIALPGVFEAAAFLDRHARKLERGES